LFRVSASDLKRQFKRLGLNVDVEEIRAHRLVIEAEDGKVYEMESPQAVLLVKLPMKAYMVQAIGSLSVSEKREEHVEISEEDVRLVAEQAGVSIEEAREALREAGGDIAAAIMLLQERKSAST
jgi:nascent polypeptide-associated complex subunit alpha